MMTAVSFATAFDTANLSHFATCLHLAHRTPKSLPFFQFRWLLSHLLHLWAHGSVLLHPSILLGNFFKHKVLNIINILITPKCILHPGPPHCLEIWKATQTSHILNQTPKQLPKTCSTQIFPILLIGNFIFPVLQAPNLRTILDCFLSHLTPNLVNFTFEIPQFDHVTFHTLL